LALPEAASSSLPLALSQMRARLFSDSARFAPMSGIGALTAELGGGGGAGAATFPE
jgi:hypothetical protein